MITDFRRVSSSAPPPPPPPSLTDVQAVKVVHKYKSLGAIIDDKPPFDANADDSCFIKISYFGQFFTSSWLVWGL